MKILGVIALIVLFGIVGNMDYADQKAIEAERNANRIHRQHDFHPTRVARPVWI